MNTLYEGLFIFPETLDEEGLDQAVVRVKEELEKLGGSMESNTRMGKKNFARPLKKQKAGHYVVMMFKLDGDKMDALKARLKLSTNVFRHQFVEASGVAEAVQEA
ncbi:30S ribosomal protein S6 [Pontiella sulfatireligans]|uniref:Small ribosomal subunit protein bS6 n=1 Tax=Pontiella sulfatireligans TaxID=2750658 RepID=A0A6C2ULW6_9BACT|nr:30S ribosomal protein S6 [Pontiella sulfatireligans]VGO20341.1 30S ribosomal protein S6 [Pontiella sulfatireligans]